MQQGRRRSMTVSEEQRALLDELAAVASALDTMVSDNRRFNQRFKEASSKEEKLKLSAELRDRRAQRKGLTEKRKALTLELKGQGMGCGRVGRELNRPTGIIYSWTHKQHQTRSVSDPSTRRPAFQRKFTAQEQERIDALSIEQKEAIAILAERSDELDMVKAKIIEHQQARRNATDSGRRRSLALEISVLNTRKSELVVAKRTLRDRRNVISAHLSDMGFGAPRQGLSVGSHATTTARWITEGRQSDAYKEENGQ